ncbi:MAG: substrate-binding domain-containing protein [Alphaproteobacteria bacterium]|nr:substrate-binding domain-containing protein [Alphaproteobacteria bacterium]
MDFERPLLPDTTAAQLKHDPRDVCEIDSGSKDFYQVAIVLFRDCPDHILEPLPSREFVRRDVLCQAHKVDACVDAAQAVQTTLLDRSDLRAHNHLQYTAFAFFILTNHLRPDAVGAGRRSSSISCLQSLSCGGRASAYDIDNRAAGRLAGLLLGRLIGTGSQRDIALFVGSRAYRGHEEREMGFRSILSDEFPELRIAAYAEVGDDRDRAYEEMNSILRDRRISGVYNIGSGNQGIARALREARQARETIFIGHDLTNASRLLLLERTLDAVIDQNPRVEAREVVRMLVSAVRGRTEPDYPPRNQVIFRENIPFD